MRVRVFAMAALTNDEVFELGFQEDAYTLRSEFGCLSQQLTFDVEGYRRSLDVTDQAAQNSPQTTPLAACPPKPVLCQARVLTEAGWTPPAMAPLTVPPPAPNRRVRFRIDSKTPYCDTCKKNRSACWRDTKFICENCHVSGSMCLRRTRCRLTAASRLIPLGVHEDGVRNETVHCLTEMFRRISAAGGAVDNGSVSEAMRAWEETRQPVARRLEFVLE